MAVAEALTFAGVISGLRSAVEAIKLAQATPRRKDRTMAIQEALEPVLAVQTSVFELKEEVFKLQEANRELQRQVREKEERSLEGEQYERQTQGNSTVYVRKGEPGPIYCVNCKATSDSFVQLSSLPSAMAGAGIGTHMCPKCESRVTWR